MSNVVYQQILVAGQLGDRIMRTAAGGLIAQVRRRSDNFFIRASTKQAAALFRDAFAVSLLKEGDDVVAWDGKTHSFHRGTYARWEGNIHVVHRQGNKHDEFETNHAVPLQVAQSDGIWGFRKGIPVNAQVDGVWHKGSYVHYDDSTNRHFVRIFGWAKPVLASFITLPSI